MPAPHLVTTEELETIGALCAGRSKPYSRSAIYSQVNDPSFPKPYGKRGLNWVWKLKQAERWYETRVDGRGRHKNLRRKSRRAR